MKIYWHDMFWQVKRFETENSTLENWVKTGSLEMFPRSNEHRTIDKNFVLDLA